MADPKTSEDGRGGEELNTPQGQPRTTQGDRHEAGREHFPSGTLRAETLERHRTPPVRKANGSGPSKAGDCASTISYRGNEHEQA